MNFLRKRAWPLTLATCALLVLASKVLLIAYAAPRVPFLDQWDGIARDLFVPLLEGRLTIADLWRIHNEHSLILTRLHTLVLYWVNDKQWDPLVENYANALLHVVVFVGITSLFRSVFRGVGQWWLLLGFFIVWMSPHAYENTLWGMQNAFYYLLGASIAAIYCLIVYRPFSRGWFLGMFLAAFAIISQRSGLLAPLSAGIVLGFRGFVRSVDRRDLTASLLLLSVTAAVLVFVPSHANDTLKASSVPEFLRALGVALAWPWIRSVWVAGFMLVPLLLWFGNLAGRRSTLEDRDYFLLGSWLLIGGNVVAIAWFRCRDVCYLTSRHSELLAIMVPLSVACWATLIHFRKGIHRSILVGGAILWGLATTTGMIVLGAHCIGGDIRDRHVAWPKQVAFVRQVSLNPSPSLWAGKNPMDAASFGPQPVVDLLSRSSFKNILPWRAQVSQSADMTNYALDAGAWRIANDQTGEPQWQLPVGQPPTAWRSQPTIAKRSESRLPIRGDWRGSRVALTMILADGKRINLWTGNAIHHEWYFVQIPAPVGASYQLELNSTVDHGNVEISSVRSLGKLSALCDLISGIVVAPSPGSGTPP